MKATRPHDSACKYSSGPELPQLTVMWFRFNRNPQISYLLGVRRHAVCSGLGWLLLCAQNGSAQALVAWAHGGSAVLRLQTSRRGMKTSSPAREPGIALQQLQLGCSPRDKSYLFKKPQRPIISARKCPWIFTRGQGRQAPAVVLSSA